MKLRELLKGIDYEIVQGNIDLEINNVEYDSRKVEKEDMFVCIKGFQADGHKYAKAAIEKEINAVVCEDDIETDNKTVNIIKTKDTRKALAVIGANLYDHPSKKMKMIGVTGTNGKTTTALMIKTILEAEGKKVGLIGTIANYIGKESLETERTTPESLELQKLFKEMVDKGCEYCVMEVSSHSLALDRVYGIEFEVGIFTNLTRDHLDFHKTFENYFQAKYKLFQRSRIKIINIDDNYGKRALENLKNENAKDVYTYSIKEESDFKAYEEKCESKHIAFKLKINGKEE